MMDIQHKHITTAQEYTDFVRAFVTLLDKQLTYWEARIENEKDFDGLAHQMPALISLVNTAGYLRGQDGVLYDFRPHTPDQQEYYRYEDQLEDRLFSLIAKLKPSNKFEYLKERLYTYFISSRLK
jgi:hypothetical protein